jgi:hypothetical protein
MDFKKNGIFPNGFKKNGTVQFITTALTTIPKLVRLQSLGVKCCMPLLSLQILYNFVLPTEN